MDIPFEMLGEDKVVIKRSDFEDLLDIVAYDKAKQRNDELFPAQLMLEIIQGTPPLKAFRKHRKLSQAALARTTGIPQGLISEIETGKKQGSVKTLKALADALDIDIDDLIE